MLPINLKKIWSHPQIISLVDEWSLALDIPIEIWDARGNLVGGRPVAAVQGTAGDKFPVEVEGSVIGWVTGGESGSCGGDAILCSQ
ncbi:hypothetical protein [[Phormidium] sp. ETS-05]|uniref:hypothetical protein n=1 Tax=[Phormidium] sp. ETS-05 TaxID=222819 RepID=UPI0018EF0D81|nr:hypothetical protein [[Phormidium] sp. ETS-05]